MIKGLLTLSTGIALFLFGMLQLNSVVQRLFTVRFRQYVKYSVRKPVYGLLTGIAATILFQSSSATTVLTIGMVSAGLITFYHSLGIILGADIGTTLTVQLVVWKFTDLAPLFIIAGGCLWVAGRKKWKSAGEAFFYFGVLFFGLSLAAVATAPLKENQTFIRFFQETRNPLFGVAIGMIFTGIVHASVIPISILVILAQYGLIGIENALPIVFGANVGTTVTALMASTVAGISGKRSAFSHFLFKLAGVVICLITLPLFVAGLKGISSGAAQQIAIGHFLFNLIVVAAFIFFLKPFARLVERIIPGEENVLSLWPEYIDDSCLTEPQKALDCVKKELEREIVLAERMFGEAVSITDSYQTGRRRNIVYMKLVLDNVRAEIVQYLWKVSTVALSAERSKRLFTFTGLNGEIGRIGDQIVSIADLLKDQAQRGIGFSEPAKAEILEIEKLVSENLRETVSIVAKRDEEKIWFIFRREEEIDGKVRESRERHLERFCEKACEPEAGPIFVSLLIHLERISDHCQNIAEYLDDLKDI
jgi:phosphate:Na+ symporter